MSRRKRGLKVRLTFHHALLLSALSKVLDQSLPLFVHIINSENDRTVVMATLETLKEMLGVVGIAMVTEQGNLSSIISSIRNVLQCKVRRECFISQLEQFSGLAVLCGGAWFVGFSGMCGYAVSKVLG